MYRALQVSDCQFDMGEPCRSHRHLLYWRTPCGEHLVAQRLRRAPQVPPPLPTTPHNEVLVYDLHGDLSGMRIRVEALQQRRPWDSVNIASQQEPPHSQAVLCSIWEDQVVLNILRAVGFSQPSQGSLTIFGGMERKRLAKHVEAMEAEPGQALASCHGCEEEAGGGWGAEEGQQRAVRSGT